jgi:hypothetical protein
MKSTFQKVAGLKDETNQYVADKNWISNSIPQEMKGMMEEVQAST